MKLKQNIETQLLVRLNDKNISEIAKLSIIQELENRGFAVVKMTVNKVADNLTNWKYGVVITGTMISCTQVATVFEGSDGEWASSERRIHYKNKRVGYCFPNSYWKYITTGIK